MALRHNVWMGTLTGLWLVTQLGAAQDHGHKAGRKPVMAPNAPPASPPSAAAPKAPAPPEKRECTLAEPEQPRGGRLELLGENFGSAPVVRIAGKPARMLERRPERLSVQIPADSNGGEITLTQEGRTAECGTLVIIGKNH